MTHTTPQNIPQGYKLTPVGIIPEDWEFDEMKNLSRVNQGLQIPISERKTKQTEKSYFYITNEFLKKDSKNEYYIENPPQSVICSKNDILMTRTGNTGLVVTNVEGVFHNNFFKIDYNKEKLNKTFLYVYLRIPKTQYKIMALAGNSTIPDLNHSDFYKIKLPIPPLSEQEKIADCLTTWDTAIEKLSALIEDKKQYKKGLMQQLLTGKKRLDGFSDEWKKTEIKNTLNYEQPTKYLTNNFGVKSFENRYPVLTSNQSFILGYTNETENLYTNLPVIIFDDFTTLSRYINFKFKVKSSATKFLKEKKGFNIRYMFERLQLIKSDTTIHKRKWISEFESMVLNLPPLEEQTAIAEILSTADREISLLEKKKAHLETQKRGLMQVLLTGKKRLV